MLVRINELGMLTHDETGKPIPRNLSVMPRTTAVRFEFTVWDARAVPNDSC